MKSLVLLIDNDLALRESLREDLAQAGFYAFVASSDAAIPVVRRLRPDVLLLSADLAAASAYELVNQLRADAQAAALPIVMYSAFSQLADKARALDAGADDFIGRPFGENALASRINGLLRHGGASDDVIELGDLRVDIAGFGVTYEGRTIDLSRTLFGILCLLARQPGRAFTREQIRNAVWGAGVGISDRSVDVCVNRLRLSLGGDARGVIKTVHGVGYKFSTPQRPRNPQQAGKGQRRRSEQGMLVSLVDGLVPAC